MRLTFGFSNLNRRRYAQNDDTLYVAPEDERTDYVCCSTFVRWIQTDDFLVPAANGELVQWCSEVCLKF